MTYLYRVASGGDYQNTSGHVTRYIKMSYNLYKN